MAKHAPTKKTEEKDSWRYCNQIDLEHIKQLSDIEFQSKMYDAAREIVQNYSPANVDKLGWQTTKYKFAEFDKIKNRTGKDADHFFRWWLDQIVESIGFEIFNAIFFEGRIGLKCSTDRELEPIANKARQEFNAKFQ